MVSSFSSSSSSPSPYIAPPTYEHSLLYSDVCPRTETVTKLAEILDKLRVALIRGPPSSGKTTLAKLLQNYYLSREEPVIFLTGWPPKTLDPYIYLAERCHEAGYNDVDFINLPYHNITFIIDEAQTSYTDTALWLGFVKSQSRWHSGARICLFASYGDPVMGTPERPGGASAHVQLGPVQRISLLTYHEPCGPHSADVGLFYTAEEFEDVLLLWSAVEIALDAREFLYYMTGGHPGAVDSLMAYILAYHSELRNENIQIITRQHLLESLKDQPALFEALQTTPVFRSFPTSGQLTPAAATALRRILQEGKIPCDLDDPGVKLCFEMGWVHTDYTVGDENLVCFLPTRLHERFLEYFLGLDQTGSFF